MDIIFYEYQEEFKFISTDIIDIFNRYFTNIINNCFNKY